MVTSTAVSSRTRNRVTRTVNPGGGAGTRGRVTGTPTLCRHDPTRTVMIRAVDEKVSSSPSTLRVPSTRTGLRDRRAAVLAHNVLAQRRWERMRPSPATSGTAALDSRMYGRGRMGSFALFVASLALLMGREGARAQFVDGGAISMDCEDCGCTGSSDDGSIDVFNNPSTGGRTALVDGGYTEVLETSCGSSVIAIGSTIYELSGIDLENRDLEVLTMSSDSCTTANTPSSADCYSGSTSRTLDGDVEMDLIVCLCQYSEDMSIIFKSKVTATVKNSDSVVIPGNELEICLDYGFLSQLVTANVGSDSYLYNFDLAYSGGDSSSDLSISPTPSSAAESICGEGSSSLSSTSLPSSSQANTPSPEASVAETPTPTAAPVEPEVSPTSSPLPPPTIAPLSASSSGGVSAGTEAPVAVDAPTSAPIASAVVTTAPVVVTAGNTSAPSGVVVGVETPSPLVPIVTPSPVVMKANGSLAPVVDVSTSSPAATPNTQGPAGTLAPFSPSELEAFACDLPQGDACTTATSVADINVGVGSYYDPECSTGAAASGGVVGCETSAASMCRACFFNVLRFQESNSGEDLPAYVDCPCCVLDVYEETSAHDEDGPRCVNFSPAPTVSSAPSLGSEARGISALRFDDTAKDGMRPGEGLALASLGVFAVLSFVPSCMKH